MPIRRRSSREIEGSTELNRSVVRTAMVLKALALSSKPIGVNELARSLKLAPATTHRILATLTSEELTEQDPVSGKYGLGSEVVPLAHRYLNRRHLGQDCVSVMQRLASATGESVNLGVLTANGVYYVQQVEGPNPLRYVRDLGLAVPLHCSALGKLLLAFMAEPARHAMVAKLKLEKHTERTITDRSTLLQHLDTVVAKGFAVDVAENIKNLIGIAVPVRDGNGAVAAGLSVMGPSMRLTRERIDSVVPKIVSAAATLSHRLGWRPLEGGAKTRSGFA